jgi:N-glycosidase YbiA
MSMPIHFYRERDPWGEFSNFSPHPITLDDQRWPTTEHYFQAQKFAAPKLQAQIRDAKGPGDAARLGRRLSGLRPDWEDVKEQVMLDALQAKFTQHPKLAALLLSTGDAPLVERTKNDHYWGDGGDGSGRNRLGVLLMQLRDELRAAGLGTEAQAVRWRPA